MSILIDKNTRVMTQADWAASLEPGWHRNRMENFNALVSGVPQEEDLVHDGWTDIIGKMLALLIKGSGEEGLSLAETLELADFQKMNEVRARVDELIEDPNTAESLKAYYRQFCKRPCFHDEYLQTFNRPNVTLVDTDGKGIDRITERGIVANGTEYELDCIVFATGFEVGTGYSRRAGYETVGRDGVTLSEHWSDGARTLHGIHSHGFPNCFIMSQTQGGFTVNYPHMLDELAVHIAAIVSRALEADHTVVEATADAEEAWVQEILRHAGTRGDFLEECTPGYYNNEGKPSERSMQDAPYGRGAIAFFDVLKTWRESGDFDGVTFG